MTELSPSAPGAPALRAGSRLPLGSFSLTSEEIVAFAREWDPMPMHLGAEGENGGPFGGLVASGMHTFMTVGRELTVRFNSVYPVVAGIGLDGLRLRAPVRPDSVIAAELVVESIEPRAEGLATVTVRAEAHDEDGTEVMVFRLHLVARVGEGSEG